MRNTSLVAHELALPAPQILLWSGSRAPLLLQNPQSVDCVGIWERSAGTDVVMMT